MGDDTGYISTTGSVDSNMTNNLKMKNKMYPFIRKESGGSRVWSEDLRFTGSFTSGSNETTGVKDYYSTLSKATFSGFSDSHNSKIPVEFGFVQAGSGITMVGHNKTDYQLTGNYQYPGYITGSWWNETPDEGIPRIGSASWGNINSNLTTDDGPIGKSFWQTDRTHYYKTGSTWVSSSKAQTSGIQRVERIPFEAIVNPARYLASNKEVLDENSGQVSELFVVHEMEPHPSASMQACSYLVQPGDVGDSAFYEIGNPGSQIFQSSPMSSSVLTSSFDLTQMRKSIDTTYSKAASNFFAESQKFFLNNGHSTILSSEDTLQQPVEQGKTYRMKLRLVRDPGVDFPMYNRPAAFGPPVDAGRPMDGGTATKMGQAHGYSPFTPPHYDGFAEVEYVFTPEPGVKYESVEDILEEITVQNRLGTPSINFNRSVSATGSAKNASGITNSLLAGSGDVAATASLNKQHAMQLSASFNGVSLADASLVPFYEDNLRDKQILRKAWVIQSKWECPNLNFRGVSKTAANPAQLTVPKGMWHQLGSYESNVSQLQIIGSSGKDKDLSQLLGMHFLQGGQKIKEKSTTTIGELAKERKISEAIVAIPFIETNTGQRRFFNLPKNEVYKAVQNAGYPQYKKVELEMVESSEDTTVVARPSVQDMVNKMLKYVIPPKMNFLKYNIEDGAFIRPFAMYIFEFEHTLSKRDLSYIWQNAPPDIGVDDFHKTEEDTITQTSVVSHELTQDGGLLSGQLNEEVKWMVFKVKQRAETNYFKKLGKDRLPLDHPDREVSVENDVFDYGYNWPYDYFSLVELVKIDAEVGFAKNVDVVTPIDTDEAAAIVRGASGLLNKTQDNSKRPFSGFGNISIMDLAEEEDK
jgi:hypothetical protein